MEITEQDHIKAQRSNYDRFKASYDVMAPEVAHIVPLIVGKTISNVSNIYYPFIPAETYERLKELPERVIVTDLVNHHKISQETQGRNPEEIDGSYNYAGNFITIKSPETMMYVWDKFSPELKSVSVNKFGSEERAKKWMGQDRFVKALIHEVIHGFHSYTSGLTHSFIEDGVQHYGKEAAAKLNLLEFSEFEDLEVKIYEHFLQMYGEAVHRIFFGATSDREEVAQYMDRYDKHLDVVIKALESK